jgi:sugar phosphate isomerase/epimerase
MPQPSLAVQTNTISQFVKTLADFAESMQKIRTIGYRAVQLDTNHVPVGSNLPAAEVKRIVDDVGLTICNVHILWETVVSDTDTAISLLRLWECEHLAVPIPPKGLPQKGGSGYRNFAREATRVGRQLAGSGLTFSYHNHAIEFVRFGNRIGLDIIFDESDPRYVQAELDTYWIQYAGGDPALWIRRMKDRMPVVHLKDLKILEDGSQTFAEIGQGNLNWPVILSACREAGVRWYVVEQDKCQGDPFDSLQISYRYLTGMDLGLA